MDVQQRAKWAALCFAMTLGLIGTTRDAFGRESTAAHKTLHTFFFVYLEKGEWAERNVSSIEMGTRAGWTCKPSEIELSESAPSQGHETRIYKSVTVTCQAKTGSKIDMLAMCDIGYENKGGGSVRLYDDAGNFGVMTAECYTSYR